MGKRREIYELRSRLMGLKDRLHTIHEIEESFYRQGVRGIDYSRDRVQGGDMKPFAETLLEMKESPAYLGMKREIQELWDLLNSLSPDAHMLLCAKYIYGMSDYDYAVAFEVPVITVKQWEKIALEEAYSAYCKKTGREKVLRPDV